MPFAPCRHCHGPLLLTLLALVIAAPPAAGQPELPDGFVDERIVAGLHFPSFMTFLPDGRILATEHGLSRVVLVKPGPPGSFHPMGTVDSVRFSGEQGLFGIAADPRWPAHPYIYVHYAYSGAPRIHISRYTVAGDLDGSQDGLLTMDLGSEHYVIVDLPDSSIIHNGGHVHFGPDSMLYLSLGDDARSCGAQSKNLLRGKILRLEVRHLPPGPGGPPAYADITPPDNPYVDHDDPRARLIWAYGLRNPWSFTMDPPTGHIVIADVGGGGEEEINLATEAGLNFGWPLYEGFAPRIACVTADTMGVRPEFPLYTYVRPTDVKDAAVAIISGGLYRPVPGGSGSFPPEYEGSIFLSDVYQGFLRRVIQDGAGWRLADPVPGQPSAEDWGRKYNGATTYAIGPDGALWYAKYSEQYVWFTGEIRRIRWEGTASVPPAPPPALALAPPAPSPAAHDVRLSWTLDRDAAVSLEILDVRGARVRRLVAGESLAAGAHVRTWTLDDDAGRRVRPGLYFARLSNAAGEHRTGRIVVIQ
jgi:glucose/arabinose dehydrogenase